MEQVSIKEAKLSSELLSKAVVKLLKQDISNRYKETREVTEEDWEFCEAIDWHPVDELLPKPEHVELLKKSLSEEPTGRTYKSAEEFFKDLKSRR